MMTAQARVIDAAAARQRLAAASPCRRPLRRRCGGASICRAWRTRSRHRTRVLTSAGTSEEGRTRQLRSAEVYVTSFFALPVARPRTSCGDDWNGSSPRVRLKVSLVNARPLRKSCCQDFLALPRSLMCSCFSRWQPASQQFLQFPVVQAAAPCPLPPSFSASGDNPRMDCIWRRLNIRGGGTDEGTKRE